MLIFSTLQTVILNEDSSSTAAPSGAALHVADFRHASLDLNIHAHTLPGFAPPPSATFVLSLIYKRNSDGVAAPAKLWGLEFHRAALDDVIERSCG